MVLLSTSRGSLGKNCVVSEGDDFVSVGINRPLLHFVGEVVKCLNQLIRRGVVLDGFVLFVSKLMRVVEHKHVAVCVPILLCVVVVVPIRDGVRDFHAGSVLELPKYPIGLGGVLH